MTPAEPLPQIILASASPRRRALLDQIEVHYIQQPVNIDETIHDNESPEAYVSRIAAEKSRIGRQLSSQTLPVLGADTSVILDGAILGKPHDQADAAALLQQLSGRTHRVLSAVSLRSEQHWNKISITSVTFRSLSSAEISAYCACGEPMDKAGGYAIQGRAAQFISQIDGSYSGVMGLPLFETAALLQQAGITLLNQEGRS